MPSCCDLQIPHSASEIISLFYTNGVFFLPDFQNLHSQNCRPFENGRQTSLISALVNLRIHTRTHFAIPGLGFLFHFSNVYKLSFMFSSKFLIGIYTEKCFSSVLDGISSTFSLSYLLIFLNP